jgi:hypothetical protein
LFSLVAVKQSVRVESGPGSTKDTFSSSGREEKRRDERGGEEVSGENVDLLFLAEWPRQRGITQSPGHLQHHVCPLPKPSEKTG